MRKLIYAMSVSIDGIIESADGDLRWSFPDAELHRHFNELDSTIDTYLYGRRLYENMVAYWPTADENPSAADVEIEYARNWKQKKSYFPKPRHRWNGTPNSSGEFLPKRSKR